MEANILSLIGTVLSITLAISPYKSLQKHGSAGNFELIQHEFLVINHTTRVLMLIYGIKKWIPSYIIPTLCSTTVSFLMLLLYYIYKRSALQFLQFYIATVLLSSYLIYSYIPESYLSTIYGTFNVCLYYASLQRMVYNYKTSGKLNIDMYILVASICNTSVWFTYGVLMNLWGVIIPNILGLVLSLVQGSVWYLYFHNLRVYKSNTA